MPSIGSNILLSLNDHDANKLLNKVIDIVFQIAVQEANNTVIEYDQVENVFMEMLQGKPFYPESLDHTLRKRGLCLKKQAYVMILQPETPNSFQEPIRLISDELPDDCMKILLKYSGNLVIIISSNEKVLFQKDLRVVRKIAEGHKLYIGLSRCFTDICELRKYYMQADQSIRFGKQIDRRKRVYYFEESIVYQLFESYEREGLLIDLCIPYLFELIKTDRRQAKEYLDTFYSYLINGRSITKTANAMFVHKNTVSYRVNRFLEALDMDLEDGEHLFQILCSIKILRYLHRDRSEVL